MPENRVLPERDVVIEVKLTEQVTKSASQLLDEALANVEQIDRQMIQCFEQALHKIKQTETLILLLRHQVKTLQTKLKKFQYVLETRK